MRRASELPSDPVEVKARVADQIIDLADDYAEVIASQALSRDEISGAFITFLTEVVGMTEAA